MSYTRSLYTYTLGIYFKEAAGAHTDEVVMYRHTDTEHQKWELSISV